MSWERGRAEIERLLRDNELQRVTPSDKVAIRLLKDAEAHTPSTRIPIHRRYPKTTHDKRW